MKNALFIFRLFISFTYVLAGLMMLLRPDYFKDFFTGTIASALGVILIAFGLFRGYRAWFVERS